MRKGRLISILLLLVMGMTGLVQLGSTGWMVSYGASLTKEEVLAVAETIDDEAAKAEILAAVNDGAEVQFRYAEDGRVASYRIIREGEAKAHQDMTEDEKKQALQLLIDRGTVPNRISVNGTYYSLNITLWMERGIIVYGETKQVNEANSVTSGSNYKDGQYRFWGYDINGGLYGNDDFPRDSDSGTPAYEKDWLTTGEIRESSIARKYIGEHGLSANSRYSDQDKKKTAELWLKENPAWKSSGITAQYILDHFYFNSVISDTGLTMGQFTGVHKSRQSGTLYYQSFAVQGKIVLFEISEGTVEERILIEDPELPAEPIEPEEGEDPSMEMEVSLSVPSQTYVGHPTTVTDSTGFTVDGAQRSATRVYAEGLAKNSFRLPQGGGSIRKNSTVPTKAQAVFDTVGTYPVMLTVTAKNGTSGSDQRSVQVVNTPSILHSLTGTQKQNRAQCINVWVATDPKRPLTELWIEIRDQLSGETVHLSHNLSAALENEKDNSDGIKTRPIEALESDELFTNCRLEFLTKFAEERQLTYTIYVRDSGGKTDQIVQEFTVTPDLAPEPSIGMEATFLRSRGQKTAEIEAVDQSRTDGDQLERRWEFAALNDEGGMTGDFSEALSMVGYEDRSFGTGQKIALLKHGVGKFRMNLTVTDVWTEATLPEYVTEADRRSASVTKDGEVINVAPQVSLEPKELTKAEILLLSADEETDRLVRSQLSQLEAALLEHGCDVSITAERMLPQTVSEDRPWTKTVEVNTPFGYQGSWTPLYEKDNFIVDDQNFYKIDATWLGSGLDEYPQPPYTITAWNGETGAVEWTYTFDESVLTVPDRGPYFAQDDSGTYLYFVSESRTLVLDKTTGAKLAVLPFAVGNRCFVAANRILTVKNDGIYRIDISTGRVTKIHSGLIGEGSARFGGRLQFVTRGGKTLYRASMDMETQKVSLQELKVAASADASYDAEAFCTDGSLLVKETCGDTIRFFLFDEDGDLRGSVSQTGAELMGTAVKDGSGNVTYVAYISSEKESGVYYTNFICCELTTGKTATVSLNNKNGYPAEPRIIAAEQVDSSAYVVAGGYLTWIADYGWGNGPAHGYPQRTKTIRFDMTTATGQLRSNGELELNDMQEYGSSSAVYGVIQSGQNGQYQSPPSGNITTLYRRYQTAEQVEQRCRSRYLTRDGSADRQETFVLTKESLEEESLAQRIQRWLDDGAAKTSTYVNLRKTAEGGALRRTMELEPDTTYYYEYDLLMPEGAEEDAEDIFSVGAAINQRSNQLTDIQYSVVKTMAESFDNNRVGNDYFSHIDPEDLVSDRLQASPIPESRKLRSDLTTLSFTVEEGCQAVLSFDYMIRRYSGSAYFGNEIRIDGERWQVPLQAGVTLEGRYTHPLLLEAGEHTVELFAATYSTTESITAIDDVTVEYVELS
ncbi:MAG: PQQ-like beta-propeller repeat protein, partial [Firmicutes bacterium]|nr:PQQ-like beta-propeller repeat protein [Bacillota bacterium]